MSIHSPHNRIELYVHAIWSTKRRKPLLSKTTRYILFKHMRLNAAEKGINVLSLNGMEDHVHCLFEMHPTQNVSYILQQLKGESSEWQNAVPMLQNDFNWQDGYAAYSVSANMVPKVMNYIYYQERHHKKLSLDAEIDMLDKMASFVIPKR
jgi:putative transposase